MDDLNCIGCGKIFPTQKRLSGHEAICDANKQFGADVFKRQRRLEKESRRGKKGKGKRAREETLSPERSGRNAPRSPAPDTDVQMGFDGDNFFVNADSEVSLSLFQQPYTH